LRLALGAIFIARGAPTLFDVWEGTGPGLVAILAAVAELAGGILLIVGWLTVPAALAITVVMLVAARKAPPSDSFFLNWEFNLAILGGLTCLMLTGPGAHSIDRNRAESEASRAAGRARLRGKV
jgi:putative oxidoreductase